MLSDYKKITTLTGVCAPEASTLPHKTVSRIFLAEEKSYTSYILFPTDLHNKSLNWFLDPVLAEIPKSHLRILVVQLGPSPNPKPKVWTKA